MNETFLDKLIELKKGDEDAVVVTLVKTRGSAPQERGARMIVSRAGLLYGTIGGGKVEMQSILHAQKILDSADSHDLVEWNLQTDVGMTCGGVVTFYFEKIISLKSAPNRWNVAVFGAGHVALELIPLLVKLDCSVHWIDSRADWLDKIASHPRLKKYHQSNPSEVVSSLPSSTFIASMTMGHAHDFPILKQALLHHNFPYVGVIGSESKSIVLKNDLRNAGVSEELLALLHCPIGEKFGNNTPYEIALSITAQLIKTRDHLLF